MGNKFQLLRRSTVGLCWIAMVAVACRWSSAQTYSAAGDFNDSGNPNGPWSYLASSLASPNDFYLLPYYAATNYSTTGLSGYETNSYFGNAPTVLTNYGSASTVNYETPASSAAVELPLGMLALDPQLGTVDARWTAPATGLYAVGGYFQDITTDGINAPREAIILQDANFDLFSWALGGHGYGASDFNSRGYFGFNAQLNAGETIDFEIYNGGPLTSVTSGLSATITSVPEPKGGSFLALVIGGISLRRPRRKAISKPN